MTSETTRPLLWLVCVNYHSEARTREFVKAFSALDGAKHMLIAVVDNSEGGNSAQSLHVFDCADASVKVLRPGKNLGYFGGAAWGLATLLEEQKLPEWVAVCNPDIHPASNSFLQALRGISAQRTAAVIAPAITALPSGTQQNPYMQNRPSYARMRMNTLIYSRPLFYRLYESFSTLKRVIKQWFRNASLDSSSLVRCALYAPHGAFILFHRSYFEEGGNLDFGAFLFGEEIFVAETARRLKLQVEFEPALSLIHQEHATTGLLSRRRITRYLGESAHYLLNAFFPGKAP